MPLQPWMKTPSTDDHLIEHPILWEDRLPKKYLEDGPRIVEIPQEGRSPSRSESTGRDHPNIGLNAAAGKKPEECGIELARFDEMIPGCYAPKARIADVDIDGVWGALYFPSFSRFVGAVFLEGEDHTLALPCVRAWNDYVLDEWYATAPDRIISAGHLARVGPHGLRGGDTSNCGQLREGHRLHREPGAVGLGVVLHRPLGRGVLGCRGDRHAALAS